MISRMPSGSLELELTVYRNRGDTLSEIMNVLEQVKMDS
jgi:hypothetical protein